MNNSLCSAKLPHRTSSMFDSTPPPFCKRPTRIELGKNAAIGPEEEPGRAAQPRKRRQAPRDSVSGRPRRPGGSTFSYVCRNTNGGIGASYEPSQCCGDDATQYLSP